MRPDTRPRGIDLKAERVRAGLTQRELGVLLGVSARRIANVEGQYRPALAIVRRVLEPATDQRILPVLGPVKSGQHAGATGMPPLVVGAGTRVSSILDSNLGRSHFYGVLVPAGGWLTVDARATRPNSEQPLVEYSGPWRAVPMLAPEECMATTDGWVTRDDGIVIVRVSGPSAGGGQLGYDVSFDVAAAPPAPGDPVLRHTADRGRSLLMCPSAMSHHGLVLARQMVQGGHVTLLPDRAQLRLAIQGRLRCVKGRSAGGYPPRAA